MRKRRAGRHRRSGEPPEPRPGATGPARRERRRGTAVETGTAHTSLKAPPGAPSDESPCSDWDTGCSTPGGVD